MSRKKDLSLAAIEKALRAAAGFQTQAAAMLNVSPSWLSVKIKEHATLQKVLKETTEYHLDIAETKLMEAIDKGRAWAIQFYLKYKGSSRGYVESKIPKEITVPILFKYEVVGGGSAIPVKINTSRRALKEVPPLVEVNEERAAITLEEVGDCYEVV